MTGAFWRLKEGDCRGYWHWDGHRMALKVLYDGALATSAVYEWTPEDLDKNRGLERCEDPRR